MVIGRDLDRVRVSDQASGRRFRSCNVDGRWGSMREHWSPINDDERLDINVRDQNSSEGLISSPDACFGAWGFRHRGPWPLMWPILRQKPLADGELPAPGPGVQQLAVVVESAFAASRITQPCPREPSSLSNEWVRIKGLDINGPTRLRNLAFPKVMPAGVHENKDET